jgi:hypothetical protein
MEDRMRSHGADYSLFYRVCLDQNDCNSVLQHISVSKNWIEHKDTWMFHKDVNGILYDIEFSISECQILYQEVLI